MKTTNAFTLLELLLVLSISLILCSMAVPHLINRNRYDLAQELDRLEVVFYYLQQRAIATNAPQELLFDPIKQSYTYQKNNQLVTHTIAPPLCFGFIPTILGPPAEPIKPITQAITLPVHHQHKNLLCAKILPSGKISPGAIYITDKEKKVLGALTCGVSQVSYIRKYLYQSNQWMLLTA